MLAPDGLDHLGDDMRAPFDIPGIKRAVAQQESLTSSWAHVKGVERLNNNTPGWTCGGYACGIAACGKLQYDEQSRLHNDQSAGARRGDKHLG